MSYLRTDEEKWMRRLDGAATFVRTTIAPPGKRPRKNYDTTVRGGGLLSGGSLLSAVCLVNGNWNKTHSLSVTYDRRGNFALIYVKLNFSRVSAPAILSTLESRYV